MSKCLLYFLCLAWFLFFMCLPNTLLLRFLVVQPGFNIGVAGIQIGIFTAVENVDVVVIMMLSPAQWLDAPRLSSGEDTCMASHWPFTTAIVRWSIASNTSLRVF